MRTAPHLAELVLERLPPGSKALELGLRATRFRLEEVKSEYRLWGQGETGEPNWRSSSLENILDQLEARLRFEVASRASKHLFVHAGAVGVDGRAILLPGSSGAGKSHLVAALVRAGAQYYSDEFALLDRRGRLHPYSQRLALGEEPGEPKRRIALQELGGTAGVDPLVVGLVLATRYQKGAPFDARPLTPGETVLELFAHTVRARSAPASALERLRKSTADSCGFQTDRGDAEHAVTEVLSLLERNP